MKLTRSIPVVIFILSFNANLQAQVYTSGQLTSSPGGTGFNINSGQSYLFEADYGFEMIREELEKIDISLVRKHYFGDEVALRYYLFEQQYTYLLNAAPGAFSGKMMIKKPLIYNSIIKIDTYLRKEVKKGDLSKEAGAKQLSRLLDYAIILLNEQTADLEKALKLAESPVEQIKLFNLVVIK